ncbi:MAG: hypothetical protein ABRQ38_21180, partial [Candidatus Eremiobacterota bacterium]
FFRTGPFKSNQYMGIAGYAAPEQYGIKPVDNRADIFGAGAVIYYMLTQDDPEKHALNFSPVRTLNQMVSMQFARFISKCVQMKAEDRCENINEVIEKLNSITFADTQVSPDKIKKKEESKIRKVQPKQVVGKELEGWHQVILWKINTNPVIGNRGFQAGIMLVLLILIYMAWIKRDLLIPSLSVKNNPPSLIYSIEDGKNLSTIDLNTSKVSSTEINEQLVDLVYSEKSLCYYGITSQDKLVEIKAGSNKTTREKTVGREPLKITLSQDKQIAYILNKSSNNISIIDVTTFKELVSPVLTGSGPTISSLTSDGKFLYILNSQQNTINSFNTKDNAITGSIPIEQNTIDLTVNFDNSKLYTVNYEKNTIGIININEKKKIMDVTVNTGPCGIVANPVADEFYTITDKTKEIQILNINGMLKDKYSLDFIPISIVTGLKWKKIFIKGRSLSGYVIAEFDTVNKKINILTQPEKKPLFMLHIYKWQ